MMLRALAPIALISILAAAPGCRKISEKLAEKAAEKAMEQQGGKGSVDLKGNGGEFQIEKDGQKTTVSMGEGAKLPSDWPKDVPVYTGKLFTASSMTSATDRHAFTALVNTNDDPSQVFAFYKSKLSSMKKTAEVNMGGMQVLTFESGKRKVSITILPDSGAMNPKDGKTGVQIVVDEGI